MLINVKFLLNIRELKKFNRTIKENPENFGKIRTVINELTLIMSEKRSICECDDAVENYIYEKDGI